MKKLTFIIVLSLFLINACKNTNDKEFKVGGIYLTQNSDKTYGVIKMLAFDESTVHVSIFSNRFDTKPKNINTSDLLYFISHVPLTKKGFLSQKPELIKVEEVSERELSGFESYIEATKTNTKKN